jgi:beta-lactamase superfamily II metal-dependent hydrolase
MGKPIECRMTELPPPNSDQIELTLFGPGYGECVVVHLGENRWIVIDSCLNTKTGKPAVLDYFNAIGISPQEVVKLIVISHWHDDHVRGLSDIVSTCTEASVCCSSALTQSEFLSHVLNYHDIMTKTTSSGVSEIMQTIQILGSRSPIKRALANRIVLTLPAEGTADSCTVTTLSPSDKEYDNFLRGIAALFPSNKKAKIRTPSLSPNDAAVAIWIEAGDVRMLLGADLEEKGEPSSGWSAIVQSAERPQGRASVFKIPHHGSITGHHDNVWSDMMIKSPIAVLSPFYHAGKRLPTDKDVARIVALAPESYITTRYSAPKSKISRAASVERTIRETVGKMRAVQPPMGWVSLRNGGKSNPDFWTVELSAVGSRLKGAMGSNFDL